MPRKISKDAWLFLRQEGTFSEIATYLEKKKHYTNCKSFFQKQLFKATITPKDSLTK